MSLRRISIFVAALAVTMAASWRFVVAAVDRAIGAVFDALAGPSRPVAAFGTPSIVGHAPTYDAPAQHFLRHEAGTAQRGSHRHI